ncbi:hypothetical protein ASG22_13470 [Chryseobacterium sp. Leaf405]|uniref:hypothetical protein n=1 Tax=Chryseobacterium sp. Leaf405 TaxID=1736367 RepID=UPI0006FBC67A|nr:hypothetical protein [Chryseobacterium sp. Leaf405]KQT23377.1 hypothetical protein ASG22_13470 [Chryseobacterium sp. Leaf405]
MNFLKVISVAVLFLGVSQVDAQKKKSDKPKSEVSSQKPLDNPIKCINIKEGTFLRINYPKNLWYMTVKDNIQTEYYNDGKDFIKSSMVFVDECNYKVIVLEKSEKENPVKVGDVYSNRIFASQDNFLRIESTMNGDKYDLPLEKIEESKK